jgi:hypothetical protein
LGSSLYEDCPKSSSVPYRKGNFVYIAQTKRELFSRSWNVRLGSFTLLPELGVLAETRRDISLTG